MAKRKARGKVGGVRKWEWAAWAALCVVPLAAVAAIVPLLPETAIMQVGLDGEPSRYGSRYEFIPMGVIMAAANALLAFMYAKIDLLWAQGLVHGVKSTKGARIVILATGVFCVVVMLGCLLFLVRLTLR